MVEVNRVATLLRYRTIGPLAPGAEAVPADERDRLYPRRAQHVVLRPAAVRIEYADTREHVERLLGLRASTRDLRWFQTAIGGATVSSPTTNPPTVTPPADTHPTAVPAGRSRAAHARASASEENAL